MKLLRLKYRVAAYVLATLLSIPARANTVVVSGLSGNIATGGDAGELTVTMGFIPTPGAPTNYGWALTERVALTAAGSIVFLFPDFNVINRGGVVTKATLPAWSPDGPASNVYDIPASVNGIEVTDVSWFPGFSDCEVIGGFGAPNGCANPGHWTVTADFAPVPLPTALPLFATGLVGLGLLGWRRKRKAAAL